MTRTLKPLILNTGALALTLILIYTGISAHDKLTWLMEVTPVIIVVPLLLATAAALYAHFPSRHHPDGRRAIHLRESPRWF